MPFSHAASRVAKATIAVHQLLLHTCVRIIPSVAIGKPETPHKLSIHPPTSIKINLLNALF